MMNLSALKKFFGSKKSKENILIILCIIAILIIFISRYTGKTNKNKENDIKTLTESEKAEEYKKKLENELSQMISSIDGVGNSKIMITLSNGTEYVYLSEKNKNVVSSEDYNNGYDKNKVSLSDNSQEKIILVDSSDGGKKALIKTEIEPTVKGVLVICDGGDDETVKEEIINIVSSLLNISTRKVSVSKLS